jgi:hypothetical protein
MKQLDQGNHGAAILIARVKDYFKTEQLINVKADVDLVIFAKEEPDDEAPPAAAEAAAASAAANGSSADCLRELTRFPAHSFILDGNSYFSAQQVRCMLCCGCSRSCTTVRNCGLTAGYVQPVVGGPEQLWWSNARRSEYSI